MQARAAREIHPRMAALVAETSDPFLQTIIDLTVPRTLFGRVLLTGDAAFVVRPHTAGGTAKAAHEASMLARALAGANANVEAALQSTERLQLAYGNALFEYGLGARQPLDQEVQARLALVESASILTKPKLDV